LVGWLVGWFGPSFGPSFVGDLIVFVLCSFGGYGNVFCGTNLDEARRSVGDGSIDRRTRATTHDARGTGAEGVNGTAKDAGDGVVEARYLVQHRREQSVCNQKTWVLDANGQWRRYRRLRKKTFVLLLF